MATTTCLLLPSKLEGITPLHGTETDYTAVWHFEQSLKAAWGGYPHFSAEAKCIFILDNLRSSALDEIRFYPETNDPEELFKILHRAFGDRRTWGQMLQQFTCLCQLPNEPLRMFSHRVMNSWQAILRAQMQRGTEVVTNHLLIDVFINGLHNSIIKKVLRDDLFNNPTLSIHDIREKALRWESISVVKDPSCGDVEVFHEPRAKDYSNDQLEESLVKMCTKLDCVVSNIIAQATCQTSKRKRRRRRRRRSKKIEINTMSTDYIPSLPQDISQKPPITPRVTVASSMSAHVVPVNDNNIPIYRPSEMNSEIVQPHIDDHLFVHTHTHTHTHKQASILNSPIFLLKRQGLVVG